MQLLHVLCGVAIRNNPLELPSLCIQYDVLQESEVASAPHKPFGHFEVWMVANLKKIKKIVLLLLLTINFRKLKNKKHKRFP